MSLPATPSGSGEIFVAEPLAREKNGPTITFAGPYLLERWRLIWHLNFPRIRPLREPASSLPWGLGSLSSVVVDVTKGLRCQLWRPDSRRLRLITLTETLIIPDITKTESNNCFIIHCFEENNDKRIIAGITVYFQSLRTWHCCSFTWHCSWKSCIARATYRLFTNL